MSSTSAPTRNPLPNWPLNHLVEEEPARPLFSQENLALAHNDVVTYHKVRSLDPFTTTIVLVAMSRLDFEEFAARKIGQDNVLGSSKKARTKQKKELFEEEQLVRVAREQRTYWKRLGFEWSHKGGSLQGYLVGMEEGEEVNWFAESSGVKEDRGVEEWKRKKAQEHNRAVLALREEADKAKKEEEEEKREIGGVGEVVGAGAGFGGEGEGIAVSGEMSFVFNDDDNLYDA